MPTPNHFHKLPTRSIEIPTQATSLRAVLTKPSATRAIVVLAEANADAADSGLLDGTEKVLHEAGVATLRVNLSGPSGAVRLHVHVLTQRLSAVTHWLHAQRSTHGLAIGYMAVNSSVAPSLMAAAAHRDEVRAVVCVGDRPDAVGADCLSYVRAATLLLTCREPAAVHEGHRARLRNARHLRTADCAEGYHDPQAAKTIARFACEWFVQHLHAERSARASAAKEISDTASHAAR